MIGPVNGPHIAANLRVGHLAAEAQVPVLSLKGEKMLLEQGGVVAAEPANQRSRVVIPARRRRGGKDVEIFNVLGRDAMLASIGPLDRRRRSHA
jgi:hypothetical protein